MNFTKIKAYHCTVNKYSSLIVSLSCHNTAYLVECGKNTPENFIRCEDSKNFLENIIILFALLWRNF